MLGTSRTHVVRVRRLVRLLCLIVASPLIGCGDGDARTGEPRNAASPTDGAARGDVGAAPDAAHGLDASGVANIDASASSASDSAGAIDSAVPLDASATGGAACTACRESQCRNYMGVNLVAGCFERVDPEYGADAGDSTFIQECGNIVACARASGCNPHMDGETEDRALCYCGSATIDDCASDGPAPDAPCVPAWQAAARSNVNADIQVRFTDLSYPAGWAYFMLKCDRELCSDAGCTEP